MEKSPPNSARVLEIP